MSHSTFEILCPACRSVVPADAPGCPTCAAAKAARQTAPAATATPRKPLPAANNARRVEAPNDVTEMSIKDYHRFLRSQMGYGSNGSAGAVTGAWVPAVLLLLLGVLVSAAVALGWL